MKKDYAELEIGLRWRYQINAFDVTLHYSDPSKEDDYRDIGDEPLQLDCGVLEELLADDDAYSRTLTDRLFGLRDVGRFYDKVKLVISRGAVPLHLRLMIDPRAPARFHTLRWETLRDPDDGRSIAKMRDVWFSRYLSSADWRPIMPRQQHELSALIAVANPDGLDKYAPGGTPLAQVEVEDELERATDAFGQHPLTVLASRGKVTLRNIIDQLEADYRDILYLVCHGAFLNGEPRLYLEKADGGVASTQGADLIEQLSELAQRPMLVVLSACQSAGAGDEVSSRDDGALAALGPRLAQAGIPAVVAMQGNVTMRTVADFMPPFFEELLRSGVVDRAMATGRRAVEHRPDWWAPVLFTRLRTGRMWYTPGFAAQDAGGAWDRILQRIEVNRCTPILGPGLADGLLGSRQEIASKWADTWQVPMAPNNREDLAKVTQYLAVYQDVEFPRWELVRYVQELLKDKYGDELSRNELVRAPYVRQVLKERYANEQLDRDEVKRELIDPSLDEMINTVGRLKRQDNPADPYRVMAELPFPMYVTTSATSLMEEALIDAHQRPGLDWKPNVDFFDWNQPIDNEIDRQPDGPGPLSPRTAPQAGQENLPLVYRLFGYIDDPDSLVVTEDDHYAWLESWTANRRVSVLNGVTSALAGTTLLFLGFGLHDADFRVLFRAIKALKGSDRLRRWKHVAVQLNPESQLIEPEAAQDYLESYFGEDTIGKVSIYWERTEVFLEELQKRWHQRGRR